VTRLVTAPSGNYIGPGGDGPLYGQLSCGTWLDPNRLLFARFAGQPPATLTGEDELQANTLTLVDISAGTQLRDGSVHPRDLNVIESCGGRLLTRKSDGALSISEPFTSFEDLKMTSVPPVLEGGSPSLPTWFSKDCRRLYSRSSSKLGQLHLDGNKREIVHDFNSRNRSSFESIVSIWPMDDSYKQTLIYVAIEASFGGVDRIAIIDVASGRERRLVELRRGQNDYGGFLEGAVILTYIP
jgi:hypothetical protein